MGNTKIASNNNIWFVAMGDLGVDFQLYLEAICQDRTLQKRSKSYVQTDVFDREIPAEEDFDLFPDFAGFDLELNVQIPQEERKPELQEEDSEEVKKNKRLPVLEGIRKYASDRVLLVGRPGSGKSTALERLLVQEAEIAIANSKTQIPVLVRLRDVRTSVIDLLQLSLEYRGLRLEQSIILELLTNGRLLVLWDGVNELPNDAALKELREIQHRYRRTPMIFTTRILNVGNALGIEKKLEMQTLIEPQMRQFACAYLGNEKGNQLLAQIGQRLREFGETPLLLWMLCGVYDKAGQVPPNLGSVFRAFVGIYSNQKGFDDKARSWQSYFLHSLAFEMMPQRDPQGLGIGIVKSEQTSPRGLRLSLLKSEAGDLFTKLLEQDETKDRRELAFTFLDDLLKHHLLQLKNDNEIEFRHQLFQEYFAAECLLRLIDKLSDLELKKCFLNLLDWTESLALMQGLLDEERQVERMLKLAVEVDLKLAARLAGAVKPQFQKKMVGIINDLEISKCAKVELWEQTRSKESIPFLLETLEDEDKSVRWAVVSVLTIFVRLGFEAAIPGLLKAALKDRDSIAAQILGELKPSAIIPSLQQALKDPNPDVRTNAAMTLGCLMSEEVIPCLLEALKDEVNTVRAFAARGLGRSGSEAAIPGLFNALEDPDSNVRYNATEGLANLKLEAAIPGLIKALENEDKSIHWYAVNGLANLKLEAAIPGLIKALENEQSLVITTAVDGLISLGSEATIPGLLKALEGKNKFVSQKAAEGLAKLQLEAAIPGLLQALENKDPIVRGLAAGVLVALGYEAAVPIFRKALEDEERDLKKSAVNESQNLWLEIEGTTDRLVEKAHKDYQNFSERLPDIESLLKALKDPNFSERRWVRAKLKDIGEPKLLSQLQCRDHLNQDTFEVILAIQERCRFYNYDIEHTSLPIADIQESLSSEILTQTIELNKRIKKMEDQPKTVFNNGTFNGPVNLAPNHGSQPTTVTYNYGESQNQNKLAEELDELLTRLEQDVANPTSESGKEAVKEKALQEIKKNTQLQDKLLSALKAGTLKAVEEFCKHPLASVFLAAFKAAFPDKKKD